MPNWNHIVREHLAVLRLPPEREIEIVEELALHMEIAYEAALAGGLSEAEPVARAVPSENPCVGGSIPSLAINRINHLQQVA
jgi:hypothetical protein